jgi:hypothetical protein
MNSSLHDVIPAAIRAAERQGATQSTRQQTPLRSAETQLAQAMRTEATIQAHAEMAFAAGSPRSQTTPLAAMDNASKQCGMDEMPGISGGGGAIFAPDIDQEIVGERRVDRFSGDTMASRRERGGFIATPGGERVVVPLPKDAVAKATAISPPQPIASVSASQGSEFGPGSLRLAFSLCGFHDALMARLRQGEKLTDSEELLLGLAKNDFAKMRPLVIGTTLDRLSKVINAPGLADRAIAAAVNAPHPMEVFALATLRSLSNRASQLLRDKGPDAALSLFGDRSAIQEPLAIFQRVFSTALDLVEVFERIIPGEATLLSLLAEALDSEIEKV